MPTHPYTKLNLKLNCHIEVPRFLCPSLSYSVIPSCINLSMLTLQRNNWYWYSFVVRNSPIGLATTPGNSVSCNECIILVYHVIISSPWPHKGSPVSPFLFLKIQFLNYVPILQRTPRHSMTSQHSLTITRTVCALTIICFTANTLMSRNNTLTDNIWVWVWIHVLEVIIEI